MHFVDGSSPRPKPLTGPSMPHWQPRDLRPLRSVVRLLGLSLPMLAYVVSPRAATWLTGSEGSTEWWAALILLAGALAAVSGVLGGRLSLVGSLCGYLVARGAVGSLGGEGRLWYLIFVPCLFFMLISAGVAAQLSRKWRRNW